MSSQIQACPCGMIQANAYIVQAQGREDCVVIDPGDDYEKLRRALGDRRLGAILLTHGHFDHILGAGALAEATGAPVYVGAALSVCGLDFDILPTPGHSKGSVCLYLKGEGALFSGDTLFRAGYGRLDLHGGDARAMLNSMKALFALPPETVVWPGHGDATTIGEERARYRL